MTTYHDPDPTPPHGTPRPPVSIHYYTSRNETFTVTLVYSVERKGWEVHTYDLVTGEITEYPHSDYRSADDCSAFADEHHARSFAFAVVQSFEAGASKAVPNGTPRPPVSRALLAVGALWDYSYTLSQIAERIERDKNLSAHDVGVFVSLCAVMNSDVVNALNALNAEELPSAFGGALDR
jgi:hypothetical protein